MNEIALEEGYYSDGYHEPFHTTLERRHELAFEEEEHEGCKISTTEGGRTEFRIREPGGRGNQNPGNIHLQRGSYQNFESCRPKRGL